MKNNQFLCKTFKNFNSSGSSPVHPGRGSLHVEISEVSSFFFFPRNQFFITKKEGLSAGMLSVA